MRVVVAVSCGLAVVSLAVAVVALRSADRSREKAERVAVMLATYRTQAADPW